MYAEIRFLIHLEIGRMLTIQEKKIDDYPIILNHFRFTYN